ncbi:AMP-binding protein [Piscinibacter sp. HJYY11]|uniref:AMP-binding protein n=1 Tax=Piscinibacter sp. HJYY11 TaxID=2801333 RepID=UPI00191F1715|nr:AMP-binding protein [Piscinibacter sp. HJYY11]MBL0726533.1 AMP-binding protein [Piscinibacter sp. HJYY11]
MNLAHLLLRSARSAGERPAVYLGTELLFDYATLARRAAALGASITERHGLQPGDRVGLFMSNHPSVLEILFGCWWAGLAVVPINPKLHPREVDYILAHSQASIAFTTDDIGPALVDFGAGFGAPTAELRALVFVEQPEYAQLLQAEPLAAPVERSGDDLAWLFYTSGTTGRPKGVMITHRNLMTMSLCYFSNVDAIHPDDAALYAAPMSHGAGLYGLPHVMAGARHVVPESRGFDAAEVLALGRHFGSVSMFAAPTIVKRIVDQAVAQGEDGTGLKTIVYGGGPMYVEDIQRALRVMGPRFVQIYGQGESPMTITALSRQQITDVQHPQHLARLGSVGVAMAAVEVRVTDSQGRELPTGETGEVLVRGDSVMAGYWRDPAATAKTLRDGWLFTGDMGSLDEHGFLTLRDRSKDVIISGGSNIYPREVEEALLHHPGVAEVSVVGRPDAEWGEVVVAFVVPCPGSELEPLMLDEVCREHIARFKRPKEYHLVDALPKNHYGKVLKTELRAQLAAMAPR